MRTMKAEPDLTERDRLVMAHVGLVKALAHRLAPASAVAGRHARPDRRRRARVDRCRGALSTRHRRAVRRLRPAAGTGRDARRAAGSRLGTAVVAQDAPQARVDDCASASRARARAERGTDRPSHGARAGGVRSSHDQGAESGGLYASPARCHDARRRLVTRSVHRSRRRTGGPAGASGAGQLSGRRPCRICRSASVRSWRSTTRRS